MSSDPNAQQQQSGAAASSSSSSSSASSSPSEFRFLIDNASVGGLIGKGGANVKRVRDESGAHVSIPKSEQRSTSERIMTIKGSTAQIARASLMLCNLMIESRQQAALNDCAVSTSLPADHAQLRMLVHKQAVGAIIGKAGAVIKDTQNDTKARIQVSNEPLPSSSEKTVSITGQPAAVEAAIARIVQQLKDNPIKTSNGNPPHLYEYNPFQHAGVSDHTQHGRGSYASSSSNTNPSSSASSYNASSNSSQQRAVSASIPLAAGINAQAPSTQKIAIPTVCAGCVIGKGGSVIRDLRAQSQTNISISDPDESAPNERVVTLTGTAAGIQHAVFLIRQLVEQFTPPSGSQ